MVFLLKQAIILLTHWSPSKTSGGMHHKPKQRTSGLHDNLPRLSYIILDMNFILLMSLLLKRFQRFKLQPESINRLLATVVHH